MVASSIIVQWLVIYCFIGAFSGIHYPIVRDMLSDRYHGGLMRKSGETGAELVGKIIGAGCAWPLFMLFILYIFVRMYLIPWLTTPR